MKTCRTCKLDRPLSEFSKAPTNADKLNNRCKSCSNDYYKDYRTKNYDKVIASERKYEEKNSHNRKEYREEHKYEINKYAKKYRLTNKDKVKKSISDSKLKRYHTDPTFRLKSVIRRSISTSLSGKGYYKTSKTTKILGCSFELFREHIESQWEDWMNWDNYGKYNSEYEYGWDIDHIIPSSSALTEEDVIRLNYYTNLQPLCSYINRHIKKDTMIFR